MPALEIFTLCLLNLFLLSHCSEETTKAYDVSDGCLHPLGISDGRIKDNQFTAPSAFDNDFTTFGAHRARLNRTGYRSAPENAGESWLKVDLGHTVVVTAIATQGYGNPEVKEWVTAYILLYSQGSDYVNFKDTNGETQFFVGNNDSNTIRLNRMILPVKANGVTLMPMGFKDNVGLRLELYGCKSDYYLVALLMLSKTPYTVDSLASRMIDGNDLAQMFGDVEDQVRDLLSHTPGFLSVQALHFSPRESPRKGEGTVMTAEVKIECLRAGQSHIIAQLKEEIDYVELQYTADQTKLLVNISLNLSTTLEGAKEILPGHSYRIHAILSSSESNSTMAMYTQLNFEWELSTVDENTGQFSPFVSLVDNAANITVTPDLPVGFTYVRVSAKPKAIIGAISYTFGFIRILPQLRAFVSGPNTAFKGGGPIELSVVTTGVLGTSFGIEAPNLEYLWSCRERNETTSNATFVAGYESRFFNYTSAKGCFAYDPGISHSTNTQSVLINPDFMVAKRAYVFQVLVTQGKRSVVISHTIFVDTNLSFAIRCVANCEEKVSTRKRFALEAHCSGMSCPFIRHHQWSLFVKSNKSSNESWRAMGNLANISLTSLTGPSLIIEKGDALYRKSALLSNQTYKLLMVAWLDDGNYAENSYVFHTNVPPYSQSDNTGCFVDPTSGEAITTKFHVECANWTDSDLPLTYQFAYKTQFGVVAFHTGWQPNVTTELPMGDKLTNYSLDLRLEILDSLGDYSVVYLAVQVTPPKHSNMMESQGQLDNLFSSGDIDRAMQMAFALLSAAGDSDGAQSYKSSLIDKMENIKVGSVEQATMVVGVLAMATDNDDGISGDSQEKALNLLGSTVDFLSSQMSNGSMDTELVQSLGTSLFSGIGNVLGVASGEAGAESDDAEGEDEEDTDSDKGQVDSDEMKEKSKQRAQNALNLVSQVGDSLLSTKAVGEKPTVFKTKSMGVVLDRQRSSDMGGKKLGEGSNGVALPSADSLFGNNGPDAVDSQMLAFKDNPFTWDMSAKTVKSSVIDFKLKSKGGDALNISGLQEPVELFIPIASQEGPSDKDNSSAESLFFKPSNGTSNLRYHRFLVSSHEVQVTIQIKPEKGRRVDVFVNYRTKPTPRRNIFNTTIPNWSSCTNYSGKSSDMLNCSSDPYTFTFSSLISGHTGPHFLGIRYIKRDGEAQSNITSKRKRRSCGLIHGRMKRSCVDVKDPPTTPPPTPMIIVPKYDSSTDVNYSLSISVSGCLYWSETKEKWTGEGCKVGPKSNSKQLHCLCTHLSAFGGDFFVAPNPIDFDKVFAAFGSLAETGNFVVLSTVCALLGLYVIGLILARREDKRDELRVIANVCINENQGDNKYLISIQTGMWRANGTTANVGLAIHGSDGNTEDITLTDSQSEKIFFSRGSINNFTLSLPEALGSLEKIRIWHDNSGDNPSWFLTQVLIVNMSTGEKAHFVANRWIAVEKEDGKLNLELKVSGKNEISGFKNLFYSRTATSLGDKHLWLSIFTRPPHNPFTRAQRLACCISILFAAMVTNAMFYNFGTPPGDAVQIGPLKVSLTQIKIGIQSSIVAIPVNVLVVTIFRQLKAKETGNDEDDGAKRRGCLPHWFVYVAWFICTMATLTSAAFIVFYSLMWGAETSNEWLVSVMVSFFQDAIVMQPLKVLLVASILSVLVKKPPEQEKIMGAEVQRNAAGEVITPNKSELERARKFRGSLVQIGRKVVEFTLFGIFILLMMVVCYGNRGVERFMVTQSMDNLFQTFAIKVKDTPTFWEWSKKFLVPNLYEVDWYNSRSFEYREGFLSNRAAYLVGMPRMRQLRIKTEKNCIIAKKEPSLARQFVRCVPFYTSETESVSQFNRPGWIPVRNATAFYTEYELENQCPKPWRYLKSDDLQVRPFGGQMATFVGGGYVADLGYNSRAALKVIRVLEEDNWIDDLTMAVFTEFTIFEPSSSLFSTIKLLFERFPTGGSSARVSIKTLSLYASSNPDSRSLFQVCQLLLMIILIVFLFAEIGKLRREKCSYFKQVWNWLELLQIASTICSLVFFFIKESQTSKYVKKLQENPFQTSSPDKIEFMSDMETYVLSFVIFIMTIKFLRLIKFNSHVCQVLGTMQKAANNVLSFMIVFVTILLAYTQVGFLVFSSDVDAYRSFYSCLRAMLLLLFGGEMRLDELRSTSRFIAPLFIFGYLFSMAMVLLNMFLAILNESYYEVKNMDDGETFADAELGAFVADYMKDKYHRVKDDTLELIEETINGIISFIRGDRKQSEDEAPLQSRPEESQSEEAKLASLDSMDDIGGDDDRNGGEADHLVKTGSRENLSDLMCESVSLSDLKEAILQIGREMRQSVTSLTSAVSNSSLYEKTPKKAVHWLDEEGESLNCDNRTSSYFFSLGSYLEDIWQKEEERRKRTKKSRPKGHRHRGYKRRHRPTRQEIYMTKNVQ